MTSVTPPQPGRRSRRRGPAFAFLNRPRDGRMSAITLESDPRDADPSQGPRSSDPPSMATKRKRMNVYDEAGIAIMDLGAMDIWDGADLALIRDSLTALIAQEGRRRIGVDMTYVKYIPSGFFGMLFDWKDRGVEIYLFDPQPNVRNMLWFRQFAERVSDTGYRLSNHPQAELQPEGVGHWEDDLEEDNGSVSTVAFRAR